MRLEEDTPVVVEVGLHNHSVQRRGYRGGRARHGSCREPFPVELQVPNTQRCQKVKPPYELDDGGVVAETSPPTRLTGLGGLRRVGSMLSFDHPHVKHTRDALWRHLTDNSKGKCLCRRVKETEVPCQSSHIGTNGDDSSPMPLRLIANSESNEIGKVKGAVSVDDAGALSPSCQGVSKDSVQGRSNSELILQDGTRPFKDC
ncbi:hypothetical protein GOBAR_AA00118 [Gossypium barbadense]|uniref:Uncharacterized protein n=1 Tax=Gossypium barbadense TaxID=3634 RepID=A0A2P5YXY0_GOSBA|nr:hypothetical protein GOBAR_AA00118 [Gossypium barbadense]